MRRSDRLADIIEIIRDGRLHLARDIAAALDVSVRTVYRDIDTLVASGVPIDGERGVGYLLRGPVLLPPMVLSLTELEALHLGMAMVGQAADEELQRAAGTLLAKVSETASNRRTLPGTWGFAVYPLAQARLGFRHMPLIRAAIRDMQALEIDYVSLEGKPSSRTIRPLRAEYWGRIWTLSSWCELTADFRAFRIDHIRACRATGRFFTPDTGKTYDDYLETLGNDDQH